MNTEVERMIINALHDAFPSFPVTVQQSPEDARLLWVMVFSVPDDKVREVKDLIYDFEEQKLSGAGVVLLPMVKNLETTRQHYPEHAPAQPTGTGMQERYILAWSKPCFSDVVWKTMPNAFSLENTRWFLPVQQTFYCPAVVNREFEKVPRREDAVPADEQALLAA